MKFGASDMRVSKIPSSGTIHVSLGTMPYMYVNGDVFSTSDFVMRDDPKNGMCLMMRLGTGTHKISMPDSTGGKRDWLWADELFIAHSEEDLKSGVYGSFLGSHIKVPYLFTSSGRSSVDPISIRVADEDWVGIGLGMDDSPVYPTGIPYSSNGGYEAQVGDRVFVSKNAPANQYPSSSFTMTFSDTYTPQIIIPSTRRS